MTPADHHDYANLTALGASALFVGDLFMTWQRTDAHTSTTGWAGWGIVAGVLGLVVMALVGARVERPRATLLAAAGMLGAAALAVLLGSVHWPAWLGLALAAVTVAAAVEAYRTSVRTPPRRTAGGNGFARRGPGLA